MLQQLSQDYESLGRLLSFVCLVFSFFLYLLEKYNQTVTCGGTGIAEPTFGLVQFGIYGGQRSLHGFSVLSKRNTTIISFAKN